MSMNQRGYFKLLTETISGYKGYETIEGKTDTDALVRERCTVHINRIKVNLDQCRGQLISGMSSDQSEIQMISSLISVARELMLELTGQVVGNEEIGKNELNREKIYELDRNILELGSQLDQLSADILSSLMAADDLDFAEREIFLQRGLQQFKDLWHERNMILRLLIY